MRSIGLGASAATHRHSAITAVGVRGSGQANPCLTASRMRASVRTARMMDRRVCAGSTVGSGDAWRNGCPATFSASAASQSLAFAISAQRRKSGRPFGTSRIDRRSRVCLTRSISSGSFQSAPITQPQPPECAAGPLRSIRGPTPHRNNPPNHTGFGQRDVQHKRKRRPKAPFRSGCRRAATARPPPCIRPPPAGRRRRRRRRHRAGASRPCP